MNEVADANCIEKITTEILILKQQTALNIIEIGKRLTEAKENLPHGEWLKWLAKEIEFSQTTANRFMRAAEAFANYSTLNNLTQSKIFALLDVPAAEREEFMQQPHEVKGEVKTIDEMTTRELQRLIKENKDLKNQLNDKPKEITITKEKEVIPEEIQQELKELKRYKDYSQELYDKNKDLEKENEAYKVHIGNLHGKHDIEILDIKKFEYAVNEFLKEATPLIYLGDQFQGMSKGDKDKWLDKINQIECFIYDFKETLKGSKGKNLILVEEHNE